MFRCRNFTFPIGKKTYIVGILNVTPDSFSDGGKFIDAEAAIAHAENMVSLGADIIDIGGESTRPGFAPVDAEEESRRVVPVVEKLVKKINIPISIDTTKPEVARRALAAGAHIINDIWGFQKAPELAKICKEFDAGAMLMHNADAPVSGDVMAAVIEFLKKSVQIAVKAGMAEDQIVVDPGIGFGKSHEQNLEVMDRLEELKAVGSPFLTGTSRKSMIGNVLNLPVNERLLGTAATVALSIRAGADFVRAHDVMEMKRVAMMTDAIHRRQK